MNNTRRPRQIWSKVAALAFFLMIGSENSIHAQVAGGMLRGMVRDASGSSVIHASVSVINIDTGVKQNAVTDESGSYSVANLLPGSYQANVMAQGFASNMSSGLKIEVGSEQVLDFNLSVAGQTEMVEVAGRADPVQTATSGLSGYANGMTIRELPLNGRSWSDLALLQPGVAPIENQPSFETGADRGTRGFGNQISISGGRPQQNNYRLDGISINDYANGGPGSVLGGNLGVDAVGEFSVLTSNSSAEYGKTSGGAINAITRSGANALHGDAYEFLRNSALDARNYFDGSAVPPFRRNQFGAALGGPIRKDKTFYFLNYEGIRQSKGTTAVSTVPTQSARNGFLHNSDGTPANVVVDPNAAKYLTFWPLPNAGVAPRSNGDLGFFNFAGQRVANEDFGVARIDHRFSEKDWLFGSYLYDRNPYTYPDNLNNLLFVSTTGRHIAAIEESHTFGPAILNSFRVGLNRQVVDNNIPSEGINPATSDPSYAAMPGQHAAQVSVTGLTSFTGGFGASGVYYAWTSYQAHDDLSLTRGQHAIKAGASFEIMQLNVFSLSNPNGQFTFGSLANFLTNKPAQFNAAFPTGLSPRGLREKMFGAYVQDDWRVTSRLALNLGLRYEMSTVISEVQGKLSAIHNLTDASPQLGSPYFNNPTLANFEPRVGLSWDPFGNGRTAVHAAFGLYDVLPLPYEFILPSTVSTPFTVLGTVKGAKLPPDTFYAGAGPLLGPASARVSYVEQNPKRNYVMQWNVNIQRAITSDLVAAAAYVGSRGVHQPYYSNQWNIVTPVSTPEGFLWPSPVGSGALLNSNFGSIRGLIWSADSVYQSLQIGLQQRLRHGLRFQASYTWSKSIDDTSASLAPDAFGNSISTLPFFDRGRGRGVSDFNIPRLMVFNGTWQAPDLKTSSGVLNWLGSGWQLGGVFRASDGIPFSATFGSDGDPLGGGLVDYPNRLTGPGCESLTNPGNPGKYIKTECFAIPTASAALLPKCDSGLGVAPQCFNLMGNSGRNIMMGPGLLNVDFSLFKNIRLPGGGDRYSLQFRAESFNLLNRTNFASPGNTDIFDSTGKANGVAGVLTATSTTAREIQFGVKLKW
jgi:hypothetical protein